jgi:two-component system CheB/CheR fusion protein
MMGHTDSPLRVLVVDDNVDTAESLSWLLQSFGHDVRTAHTGLGAIDAAHDFRPDAVLLDVGLPDVDGFEVARRLRAAPGFDRTVLVAATGYSRDRDRVRAAEAGFDHYLVKPFDPGRFDRLLTPPREPVLA